MSMMPPSLSACDMSWVVIMMLDLSFLFIFKTIFSIIPVFSLSTDAVGSSRKSISGSMTIALAMPSLYSKQAFTLWIRHVDSVKSAAIFIAQVSMALLIMMGILGEAIVKLLPYALIPAAYIMLLYFAGEHAIVTEICGFALLALSSIVAKFANTNVIDNRLYAAFAVFAYY